MRLMFVASRWFVSLFCFVNEPSLSFSRLLLLFKYSPILFLLLCGYMCVLMR